MLPIFGKRRSFEQLVALCGRGIPVRAMLDELTQIDAVERLPDQRVKAKSRIPIPTGLTGDAIAAIGERTGDLLETLTNNLRRTAEPSTDTTYTPRKNLQRKRRPNSKRAADSEPAKVQTL